MAEAVVADPASSRELRAFAEDFLATLTADTFGQAEPE
jgi:hypothetical protein